LRIYEIDSEKEPKTRSKITFDAVEIPISINNSNNLSPFDLETLNCANDSTNKEDTGGQ
jgi:hypothetical protein